MGKQVATLPGLGSDLSHDASLKLVLRRALQEAMAAGMALGVVACGSPPLESPKSEKADAAAEADDSVEEAEDSVEVDAAVAAPTVCLGLRPLPCLSSQWLIPKELHPGKPVSYLAAADRMLVFAPAFGIPCEDAQNKRVCLANLEEAQKTEWPSWSLLATRGDEVLVLKSAGELAKFLAPIDTATEAAAIAAARDLKVSCDRTYGTKIGVQCLADGFKVVFPSGQCNSSTGVPLASAVVSTSGAVNVTDIESIRNVCPLVQGRAPDGLSITLPNGTRHSDLAQFLLDSALFEAASIPSFLMLAEDLRALDAPNKLVQDALAAAQDEVVHASAMASLAQSAGASAGAAHVPSRARKSLWEVAQENAVEACVRETYGALLAHHQAACATDPAIAEAMASIAEDETRHAALGHRIAIWAEDRLSDHERGLLRTLRSQAISTLRADVHMQYEQEVYVKAGMPTPAVASCLLDSLERHVWSQT